MNIFITAADQTFISQTIFPEQHIHQRQYEQGSRICGNKVNASGIFDGFSAGATAKTEFSGISGENSAGVPRLMSIRGDIAQNSAKCLSEIFPVY